MTNTIETIFKVGTARAISPAGDSASNHLRSSSPAGDSAKKRAEA